jgi:single-stranded-DNA-specific exonuclease
LFLPFCLGINKVDIYFLNRLVAMGAFVRMGDKSKMYLCQKVSDLKKWLYQQYDEQWARDLARSLSVHPLLGAVLAQRGITSVEAAKGFLKPNLDDLHDPYLMQDMDKAVRRLNRAIIAKERILLYGDYDVDGTTCVALMYAFVRNFYTNIDYYIPDRDSEGYGLSAKGIEYARAEKCTLLIAMDCGIKGHASVALANSYGIDCIVCDHHTPEGGLPDAHACLNPKRPDCNYPFKDLSGCGIVFKLAQAYASYNSMPVQELAGLLDFVVLSIACDVVPMVGENRILAHFGLEKLNRSPRLGLWALINKCGRSYPLSISDLVFGLGPMINAAGRLGDARDAVRLMLSLDRNHALDAAERLAALNRERKTVDAATTAEARSMATDMLQQSDLHTLVLFNPEWHKGIVGIVASRISQELHRPTIVLTLSDGLAVGSARSVEGFDLYGAIHSCGDIFHSFGGHAHAVGIQMPADNVPVLRQTLEGHARAHMTTESKQPSLEIAAEMTLDQANEVLWRDINRLAPFGPGNMNPVFVARDVQDSGRSRFLENNHVRISAQQGNTKQSAIGFGMAAQFREVRHRTFDMAFNLREEQWQDRTTISLHLKDLH